MRRRTNGRAFSLMELMVVIVVSTMGFLALFQIQISTLRGLANAKRIVIPDGMIVKVQAALEAANDLGRPIEVATWRYPDKLAQLFSGESIGTQFLPQ